MQSVTDHALRATQQLLDCVARQRPGCIRFVRDEPAERQLTFYLTNRQYFTVLFTYGHTLLLALLHVFEDQQQYEDAQKIVAAIRKFNTLTHSNLKTR